MPRNELCMNLNSVQKGSAVNGIVFHDWSRITGGMNCVLHEPITDSVRFDVLKMKICRGASRNVPTGVTLVIL